MMSFKVVSHLITGHIIRIHTVLYSHAHMRRVIEGVKVKQDLVPGVMS